MTLQEAYQGWQQLQQNRALFAKTREAFRKVWFHLQPDQPCQYYTKEILGEALALSDQAEENKAKAASVMIHVLTYAHQQEPADNPKPRFTFGDLMACAKQPAKPQKKIKPRTDTDDTENVKPQITQKNTEEAIDTEKKPKALEKKNLCDLGVSVVNKSKALPPRVEVKRQICQLDLRTLKVLKTWETPFHIKRDLGIHNVRRAIERCGIAGGFYWSFADDVDTFADRLAASRDHKAQVRVDHCAKMRAAKKPENKPQNTRKDTEKKPKTPEKKDLCDLSVSVVKSQNNPCESVSSVAQEQSVSSVSSDVNKSSDAKKPSAVQQALAVFTDDELFAELDRRGWFGYFSRTEIVTIGNK